ncbi:5-formyltetrahydrofolate cyclo-ligase [Persicimonas caeni]|uniref:5-formyltetrahydrofolate cyclo-ligase n=1 Tax=Persicimonas caeni TaxID=2292766 RepID=A0A4Y6PV80_PERCE|nr:5-formyltetrahydrofolate cyclo-ligase [Persicimonas caeni]QDG52150.1 5-formyltetrahydrofolate cyclo-ligase [Persicimonas caeni]QED33372.1 5-formyltetrahydrofolate cyclo-ligase [Persicimonas caeni]
MTKFDDKQAAREWVWERLREEGQARFPFPVTGRIPNFAGAEQAAERLLDHPIFAGVERIKCNPDSPQKPLRRMALERGITVFVPTPRLKGGFLRFDPHKIPADKFREASALSKWDRWKEEVDLDQMPQLDLIVTGCVAVTEDGRRAGKGEGYSDLEFGILEELGHERVPVVTTVHETQIVGGFPIDAHDIGLHAIATPERIITPDEPPQPAGGIDWEQLDDEDLAKMPVLRRLKAMAEP